MCAGNWAGKHLLLNNIYALFAGCFLNQFVPWGAVCKTNTLRWRQCEVLKQQEEQVGREEAATEEEEEEVEEANEDREGKVAGLLPASGSSGVKPVHGKPGMKVFSAVPEGGLEVREATKEEEEEEEEAEVAVEAVEMAIEEVFEDVIKTLKEIEDPIEDWDH